MHPWLVRRVLHPLHERLRGRATCSILRQLSPHDSWTPEQLDAHVAEARRKLLAHAIAQVPAWRRRAKELALSPENPEAWPTMDKAMIRDELEDLVAENWRDRVFRLETGGSSGQPLIFYTDRDRESSQLAAKARCRAWWGVTTGDHQMDLWGSPIELGAQDRFRIWKDGLLNFRMLSAFRLSDEAMTGFREALHAHRTDYVYGYASVIDRYARFLEERGETLHDLALKVAVTTAEMLYPDQRERIERVLGCGVANEYGCRDGGYIAQECPEGGMHVSSDTTHVEVVDDEGRPLPPGELGDVAVTNLWSYGFPIIRYRTGDRARLSTELCRCGRPYPLLSEIGGRTTDMLFTPDGNRVHGLGVIYVLRVLPGVDRFQVVQDAVDHVEVRIVPRSGMNPEELTAPTERGVREVLGAAVKVDVAVVDELEVLPSGKHKPIVVTIDEA